MTKLNFNVTKSEKELKDLYDYNVDVFTEDSGFCWDLAKIKKDINQGWMVYSVTLDKQIVAAAFLKPDSASLLTKHTPIKMLFQGKGVSHKIKDFYEQEAKKLNITNVKNLCPDDNFRNISLNESHGYIKTESELQGIPVWEKKLP